MSTRSRARFHRMSRALLIGLVALLALAPTVPAALPSPASPALSARFATPEWMPAETVTQLGIVGGPVLAPSYIPGGLGFLPSVTAYPGYYSFYWLVPGSPPTYLQVTGTVGGSIPAYSKYDRNNQITQNATVLGYPAYHDLTPIYDLVYVDIGGVVYTVEGNNIGESSLAIANSLTYVDIPVYEPEVPTEVPPQVPVEEPVVDPGVPSEPVTEEPAVNQPVESTDAVVSSKPIIVVPEQSYSEELVIVSIDGIAAANLTATDGAFTLTSDASIDGAAPGSFEWIAPQTDERISVRFTLTDPATGEELAAATTQVDVMPDELIPVTATALSCPAQVPMGSLAGIEIDGTGQLLLDASDGRFPDVGPNGTFASPGEVDESDILQGVIRSGNNAWVFFEALPAPEAYTTFLFLQDWAGTTLLECGIEVVPAGQEPAYPVMGPHDGTGTVAGLGIAIVSGVPDNTVVNSPEMPALGLNPDGTMMAIALGPETDGTGVNSSASAAAPNGPSDGTSIDDPVSSGTPGP